MEKIMEKIFEYITENQNKYLAFWEKICGIEGTADDKASLDSVADAVEAFARSLGFFVERIPFENCGDFLIVDSSPNAEKGCAFLAHMDTVHRKGAFGFPPVKREGNKLIGPGVIDCKGGIAIALLAMKALSQNGFCRNNRLILTSDEEVSNRLGGERELALIKNAVLGYKAAFNCEVGKDGEAVVSRKGILRYRFEIKGVSAHSGIDYFSGASALREAAYKIIALESLSEEGKTTYNCSMINGGTLPNIVPERCEFSVDARVLNHAAMQEAETQIREIAEKSFVNGTSTRLIPISRRDPMLRNEATEKLFSHLDSVSQKYGMGALTAVESGGGSDSAYTQQAGVPSICAVGASGDYCHTAREFAFIDSLVTRAKLLSAATAELF
ncbi:MAG: M20/M25/M40 family metallo-hydrolase [Clostridia bacterium]|nr:M20/M25/M40 family metallo-hydrolase [Clostridia bacterium]